MIDEILRQVFMVLFMPLFYWTGEGLLYVITLGRHKPKWELSAYGTSVFRTVMKFNASYYLGVSFWMAVLIGGLLFIAIQLK